MAETVWAKAQQVANTPYAAYPGQLVSGLTPDQMSAYNLVRQGVQGGVGSNYLTQAGQAAQAAAGYQPQMVGAPNLGAAALATPASAGPAALGAAANLGPAAQYGGASINRGDIRNVQGGLGVGFMDPYQNRWTNDVVNTTLSDLDRARQMAIVGGEDAALRSGAYGGSRHGVADSLTNEAALRQAAMTTAQLRSQGFDTAANLGMADAGRYLQAGMANQGYDANVAGQNAAFAQQAGLANAGAQNQFSLAQAQARDAMSQYNAGAQNQMSLANAQLAQQAGLANAGALNQYGLSQAQLAMQAGLANQQAGLAGANLGLGASQQLAGLSDAERAQYFQNAAALEAAGGAQQTQDQRALDSAYQQFLREQNYPYQQLSALIGGQNSAGTYGQTVTLNPSTTAQVGQGLSTIGGLLSLFGG
jgi:hypothetical protein